MKSMLTNLQTEIETLKNPVDSFLTKWIDEFEAMRMLRGSRCTIDNYIKAGKLKPVRINKRNHFAVTKVKGLIHVPEMRSVKEDIQRMIQAMASLMEEE